MPKEKNLLSNTLFLAKEICVWHLLSFTFKVLKIGFVCTIKLFWGYINLDCMYR